MTSRERHRSPGSRPPRRWRLRDPAWADALCAAVVLVFAVWTLCCHLVVFTGGSLRQLIGLFALVAIGSVALLVWRARMTGTLRAGLAPAFHLRVEDFAMPAALRRGLGATGVGVALVLGRSADDFVTLWFAVAAVLLVAGLYVTLRPGEVVTAPPDGTDTGIANDLDIETARGGVALLLLALACAAVALAAHGSNADDTFYVSLAVAEVDAPSSPLLDGDPMHGVDGLPLYIPIYRAHSFEMLCAAVSYLTGVPAIAVFHLLATAAGAFLLPLAWAALLRRLLPEAWLLATLVLMIVLVAPGDAVRWYGNLAFFRPWQGKSLFLSVMTPLLYLEALRFTARPGRARWLRLAAGQVAALGLTSTAFWAAPVAVALALLVGLRRRLESLPILAWGLASSAYLVILGLLLKSSVVGAVKAPPALGATERLDEVFPLILGRESAALWVVSFAAVAAAWTLAPAGLLRRFALLVPLGAWLIFINPYLGGWIMAHVTHRQHWRSMWALPLPLLILLLCLAPYFVFDRRGRQPSRRAWLAVLCLAALFALFVPRVHGPSAGNGITFFEAPALGLKVPPAYAGAGAVHDAFAPGRVVAAPPEISAWMPTFHDGQRPLAVRFYLRRLGPVLGEENLRQRDLIPRLLVGDTEWQGAPEALRRELESYGTREEGALESPPIDGVVLPASRQRAAYREVLDALGFTRLASAEADALDLELWRRGSS